MRASCAVRCDNVDDARRNACFKRSLGDEIAVEHSTGRRLDYQSAARQHGRRDLAERKGGREIPRHNRRNHPDGLTAHIGQRVIARRDDFTIDLVRPAGVILQTIKGSGNVLPARCRQRLSGVDAFQQRDLFAALAQQRCHAIEYAPATRAI